MAFVRSTLKENRDRVRSDLAGALETSPILRRAVLGVLSVAIAGVAHMLYGFIEWVFKQMFPDTADEENVIRAGSLRRITLRPATFAQGPVTITGRNDSVIPAGWILQHMQTSQRYTTDAEVKIAGGVATANVTAEKEGPAANMDTGVELQLVSPIAGVDSVATVAGTEGIAGGTDIEKVSSLLDRILDRLREPPAGGNDADYVRWAKEVTNVTRAWVYPAHLGPGTVGVTFVVDDDPSSIIPSGDKQTEVQDHIDALAPVTAEVFVFAPIEDPVTFQITITPDNSTVRAAVEAELRDLMRRESAPRGARNADGKIYLSRINEAISSAAGETDHVLVSPVADIVPDSSHIATFGGITWV